MLTSFAAPNNEELEKPGRTIYKTTKRDDRGINSLTRWNLAAALSTEAVTAGGEIHVPVSPTLSFFLEQTRMAQV